MQTQTINKMVLDIDKVCRLCLELASNSIFYSGNRGGHPTALDDDLIARIYECTSLQVTTGEGLPESVCESCTRLVDKFILFRKMCWEVDDKLRQHFFPEKDGKSQEISVPNPVRLDLDQVDLPVEAKSGWMDSSSYKGERDSSDDDALNGFDQDELDDDYMPPSNHKFTSDKCKKSFSKSSDLKVHSVKEHSKDKTSKPLMTCNYCDKSFKQAKRFNDHMKIHTEPVEENYGEESSELQEADNDPKACHRSVIEKENGNTNQLIGDPSKGKRKKFRKVYDCEYCDQVFHSHAKFTQHELTHTGEKKYNCSDCSRSFTHKHSLVGHIKEQHTGEVNFTCDVCGRGFVHQSTFNIHKKTHSTEKPLKCPDCDKCFTQMKNLRVHRQIHSASRTHTCQVCGKSFNFLKTLKVHLVLHSGEKPFVCTYCGKAFAQSAPLKTHTRIHTGEKPYQCTLCPQRFSTNNALKSHVLKHSGEAPYSCLVCKRGFARKKDMVAHQEESHSVFIGLTGPQNNLCSVSPQPNMVQTQNCLSQSPGLPSMLIVPDIISDPLNNHVNVHHHIITHQPSSPFSPATPSLVSHSLASHHSPHIIPSAPQLHSSPHLSSSPHLPSSPNGMPQVSPHYNATQHGTDLVSDSDCNGD